MLSRTRSGALAALLGLALLPASAIAQEGGSARFYVQAFGVGANFGRFLEQFESGGERELIAATSGGGGVSLGAMMGKNALEVSASFIPSEFEFEDDTGIDSDALDESINDMSLIAVSAQFMRFLRDPAKGVALYTVTGLALGIWNVDEDPEGEVFAEEDETLLRLGFVAGGGVQFMASDRAMIRIEVTNSMIQSPFDGSSAYRVTSGDTFDENDAVRVTQLKGGLTYTF